MTLPALLRRLAGVLLLLAVLSASGADASGRRNFLLPGGDAAMTLKQFTEQSGGQVMYLVDSVRGITTHAVRGRYAPREALKRMLAGTPLAALEDERTGALTISRSVAAVEKKIPVPAAPAVSSAEAAGAILELSPFEVNVTRDRG